jgi:hypothetical protein
MKVIIVVRIADSGRYIGWGYKGPQQFASYKEAEAMLKRIKQIEQNRQDLGAPSNFSEYLLVQV